VRAGHALYGYVSPARGEAPPQRLDVKPALTWKARLLAVKDLPEGALVGYGGTFRTPRAMRIGVLGAGYADGIFHRLSNRGKVIADGKLTPILGTISMDLTTIDLSHTSALGPGDEVTLLGQEGDARLDAQQIARVAGTISYNILCSISARVTFSFRRGRVRVGFRVRTCGREIERKHAPQQHHGAIVILRVAADGEGFQQVGGEFGIVRAERALAPRDGLVEVAAGRREIAGGSRNAREAFEDVVAGGIGGGGVIGNSPRRVERLARGVVVAQHVARIARVDQGLDASRGLLGGGAGQRKTGEQNRPSGRHAK
jgi:hypothetical protein